METSDTSIAGAQRQVAAANIAGAPGVLVSGLVWLIAGLIWIRLGVGAAFLALFLGGMLIFPVSMLIARTIFRAPGVPPGNVLERLGLEVTFFLFGGLAIAFALLRVAPELVFPTMAITIGVRYFAFRTLYGQPLYWLLAALLAAAGVASLFGRVPWPGNLALVVGAIEVAFALLLFLRNARVAPELRADR